MTDWLEAVAARGAHVSEFASPCIPLTVSERDRLVRIARGVRELGRMCIVLADAKESEAERKKVPVIAHALAGAAGALRAVAAELRKLEDV